MVVLTFSSHTSIGTSLLVRAGLCDQRGRASRNILRTVGGCEKGTDKDKIFESHSLDAC